MKANVVEEVKDSFYFSHGTHKFPKYNCAMIFEIKTVASL